MSESEEEEEELDATLLAGDGGGVAVTGRGSSRVLHSPTVSARGSIIAA